MRVLPAFVTGLLFAGGLGLSGMTNTTKVLAFFDVAGGAWDPSLAFVMAGAIGVHLALYRLILRRPSPVYGPKFRIPTRRDIDPRLVGGAALFGVGWGLSGYCPGPGLVAAAGGMESSVVFVLGMVFGMVVWRAVSSPSRAPSGVAKASTDSSPTAGPLGPSARVLS